MRRTGSIYLFFFLLLAGLPEGLQATHIIGGEIYYDCFSNSHFRIVLKLYRDCLLGEAPYDDPATISVFDRQGNLIRNISMSFPGSRVIPSNSLNPCFLGNTNLCVEEAVYEQIVMLPPRDGGYILAYQRCCRNESILNIYNPGATGSTYTTEIPASAWTDCNSSPRFNDIPPIVLCINDSLLFDHAATDPDGDSLVYSFCNPYNGASIIDPKPVPASPPPYGNVHFIPPYSATYPIASSPPLNINEETGIMKGFPTQLGQYVMAVCVSEYRNGTLLSTNMRDFQFNVLICTGVTTALFSAPSGEILPTGEAACKGLEVHFINESLNSRYFSWDFGIPDIITDVSTQVSPIYAYPDTGYYRVRLITNPGYSCADTAYSDIYLQNRLEVEIRSQPPGCLLDNAFAFTTRGVPPDNASYNWRFTGPADHSTSSMYIPLPVHWSDTGSFEVYLTITTRHCRGSDTSTILVLPPLAVDFTLNETDVCAPGTVVFLDGSISSEGARFYWDFGDGATSTERHPTHVYREPGLYDVSLTVTNIIGCIDTFTRRYEQLIRIRPRPAAAVIANPGRQSLLTPLIRFQDHSTGALGAWVEPGDGTVLEEADVQYAYQDTGWFNAALIAVNEHGCYDTTYAPVRIDPIFTCFIPNAFTPDGDGINEVFAPKGEGFRQSQLLVFDRWGQEVFSTDGPFQGWDGSSKTGRTIAPAGVYNYRLLVRDVFKQDHIFTGMVMLVR